MMGRAGLDDAVAQPAPLRHGGRDRRPRDLADPQPPQQRGRDLRVRSTATPSIRAILGVGPDFEYEIISKEDWVGRRLVADRFRNGRAFICGDAAHLWMPYAGYGMNAGIADATNLAWLLAAVLHGWAEPAILDAYEAERQPITEQVSRFAMDMARKVLSQRRAVPTEIELPGPEGDAVRAAGRPGGL